MTTVHPLPGLLMQTGNFLNFSYFKTFYDDKHFIANVKQL